MIRKTLSPIRIQFRRLRQAIIRFWRLHSVVPKLLRFNAYTGFIGRRLFYFIPFLLPHDKSYYGFSYLVQSGDGLFLDVGANDGISAIGFHHIHSDYRILSLEPNRCHEVHLKKLTHKLKGFQYRIIGAGDKSEEKILYVPYFQGVPIYTAASLDEEFVKTSMKRQFKEVALEAVVYEQHIIEIKRIDELLVSPDIIKIDTEGHDFAVLSGAQATIERSRPFIMIEFNPRAFPLIQSFLKEIKYELYTYDFKKDIFHSFHLDTQLNVFKQGTEAQNIFCIPYEKLTKITTSKRL